MIYTFLFLHVFGTISQDYIYYRYVPCLMVIGFRDIEPEDARLIARWKSDPYIKKMALDPADEITVETEMKEIERAMDKGLYLIVQLDGEDIGYVKVDWVYGKGKIAWLRFALGEHRGEGYGVEMIQKISNHLFERECVRIEAEVYSKNVPSQKVLEKNGFVKEGTKRKAYFDGDKYADVYVYGKVG